MAAVKILPHNDDAEKSVLGAILIDKDAANVVSGFLQPSDFYSPVNGLIFESMLELYNERKAIDLLTVRDHLKKKKQFEKIDTSYFTELIEAVPTAANVENYGRIVKEASTKRALIHAGVNMAESGYDDKKDVKEILDMAEASVFAISQGNITRGFIPIKDTLAQSFDRIDELHKGGEGLRGVKTGFTELDKVLSGFQKSNLIILAARPGQGKTAITLNMAQLTAS